MIKQVSKFIRLINNTSDTYIEERRRDIIAIYIIDDYCDAEHHVQTVCDNPYVQGNKSLTHCRPMH